MEKVWLAIVSTILAPLIAFLIKALVDKRNQKRDYENKIMKEQERQKAKDEIANYVFGQVSILLNEKIKVIPDIKKQFDESYKRYRSLDIIKEIKEKENIIKTNNKEK